jgi:DNA repair protein RadC
MDKSLYLHHRQRVMDNFLKNPHSFEKYEMVELLLMFVIPHKDLKPLAKNLIKMMGSINGIIHSNPDFLLSIEGLGKKSVVFLLCIKKITELLLVESIQDGHTLPMNVEKIASYSMFILSHLNYEQIMVFIFDSRKKLIKDYIHSKGSLWQSPMYFRELLMEILNTKGVFVVLVHNHPSGNPHPSSQDIEVTKKIHQILLSLDICLYDHLIIGGNNYISMKKLSFF